MTFLRTLGTLVVTGTVLAFLPVGSASAADSEGTVATFTLAGGELVITTADNASLTDGASGDGSVSGPLGEVLVSDDRGDVLGWVVSASSTAFTDGAGSSSTGVGYDAGTVDTTGIVDASSLGAAQIASAVPVVEGTDVSGNNTASYDPTLTVALPASALAGDYTGTVTTSVL